MLETKIEALSSKRINTTKILINFPYSCPVDQNGPILDQPVFPNLKALWYGTCIFLVKNTNILINYLMGQKGPFQTGPFSLIIVAFGVYRVTSHVCLFICYGPTVTMLWTPTVIF